MRKAGFVLFTLIIFGFIFFASNSGILKNIIPGKGKNIVSTKIAGNPYGVMVGAPFGMSLENKIKVASQLGVSYYRPATAVFLEKWNGNCRECQAALDNGLKLVLTVRNGGGHGEPSTPPSDEKEYLQKLGSVLEVTKPTLLVVENEENSMELFYSGSSEEYLKELKIACQLAHTEGIKCTNGGLVSSLVIGLIYNDYLEKGESENADRFLEDALTVDKISQFKSQKTKIATQLKRGKELIAGYKSAGVDYVNFHWYSDSPAALSEAKNYLERTSALTAISNEMGQQENTDPDQVVNILNKVLELKLPIAVWYSIDTLSHGKAQGLSETDGSLRENGLAFRKFIQDNFGE